ncbi:hypothetical protein K1719_024275 [Acacia pycnantha]|nr:hypothetical protein K1719_024275 [Acacia pycnantha]
MISRKNGVKSDRLRSPCRQSQIAHTIVNYILLESFERKSMKLNCMICLHTPNRFFHFSQQSRFLEIDGGEERIEERREHVERRFDKGAFYSTTVELEGMVMGLQRNSGRVLFANERVFSLATNIDDEALMAGSLCNRFSVSLIGICSGNT